MSCVKVNYTYMGSIRISYKQKDEDYHHICPFKLASVLRMCSAKEKKKNP